MRIHVFSRTSLHHHVDFRLIDLSTGQTSSRWVAEIVHWLHASVFTLLPEAFSRYHDRDRTFGDQVVGKRSQNDTVTY